MIVVVMGVCGCGKTVIGRRVADALGIEFAEGDDFHPPANVEKMRGGTPLSDADRGPWLETLAAAIDGWLAAGRDVVLTCSALRRRYRDVLIGARQNVFLVYLEGDARTIGQRLAGRRHEYMPASLLSSQFAALEAPEPSENPITVDIAGAPEAIVAGILERLPGPSERKGS